MLKVFDCDFKKVFLLERSTLKLIEEWGNLLESNTKVQILVVQALIESVFLKWSNAGLFFFIFLPFNQHFREQEHQAWKL